MKSISRHAACAALALSIAAFPFAMIVRSANEIAISDESGRTCAQTMLGADSTKTETRLVTVDSSGALIVNPYAGTLPSTFEFKRYAIPPTKDSGTNLNPAAASKFALVSHEGTGEMRVMLGSTAGSASVGIPMFASQTISFSDIGMSAIHVYNTTSATATVSIMYVR